MHRYIYFPLVLLRWKPVSHNISRPPCGDIYSHFIYVLLPCASQHCSSRRFHVRAPLFMKRVRVGDRFKVQAKANPVWVWAISICGAMLVWRFCIKALHADCFYWMFERHTVQRVFFWQRGMRRCLRRISLDGTLQVPTNSKMSSGNKFGWSDETNIKLIGHSEETEWGFPT